MCCQTDLAVKVSMLQHTEGVTAENTALKSSVSSLKILLREAREAVLEVPALADANAALSADKSELAAVVAQQRAELEVVKATASEVPALRLQVAQLCERLSDAADGDDRAIQLRAENAQLRAQLEAVMRRNAELECSALAHSPLPDTDGFAFTGTGVVECTPAESTAASASVTGSSCGSSTGDPAHWHSDGTGRQSRSPSSLPSHPLESDAVATTVSLEPYSDRATTRRSDASIFSQSGSASSFKGGRPTRVDVGALPASQSPNGADENPSSDGGSCDEWLSAREAEAEALAEIAADPPLVNTHASESSFDATSVMPFVSPLDWSAIDNDDDGGGDAVVCRKLPGQLEYAHPATYITPRRHTFVQQRRPSPSKRAHTDTKPHHSRDDARVDFWSTLRSSPSSGGVTSPQGVSPQRAPVTRTLFPRTGSHTASGAPATPASARKGARTRASDVGTAAGRRVSAVQHSQPASDRSGVGYVTIASTKDCIYAIPTHTTLLRPGTAASAWPTPPRASRAPVSSTSATANRRHSHV